MNTSYGFSEALIDRKYSTNYVHDVDDAEPFIVYSAIGKGHRFALQFATSFDGKYPYIPSKEVEKILNSTGHTIRRLVVEEDMGNRILLEPNYKTLDLMQEYCTGLRELTMINFVEIPEDAECIMGKLRKLSLTNCTLAHPLRQYLHESPLQQLELTKTAVEFEDVKLPQLKHLKLTNCILTDLASLFENSPKLEVLELIDCQLIGKSIEYPDLLNNILTLNIKSNENWALNCLVNFRNLSTLKIWTELIADKYIQAIIAADHSLQSITLDANVSVRTMRLISKEKSLRHFRVEGQCVAKQFTDNHFAALGKSHLHELEVVDFNPEMPDLIHVISTSMSLISLKLGNSFIFDEKSLTKFRNAANAYQ